jgi:hypothetical protein
MIKNLLPLFLVVLISCGTQTQKESDQKTELDSKFASETHQEFVKNLGSLCGNSFKGEEVFRSHHGESWAQKLMIMHVTLCDDDKVHIPFHVDSDHSRTWMFEAEEGKLRFKHQHLHEDGTPEEGSMYGGYANENGTAFVQYFHADEYTGQVIEGGAGNLWIVTLAEDLSWFSYRLERDGEKRFELRFDLTKPIE